MGKQPMNRLCAGWRIIMDQICGSRDYVGAAGWDKTVRRTSGNLAYRMTVHVQTNTKSTRFSKNIARAAILSARLSVW